MTALLGTSQSKSNRHPSPGYRKDHIVDKYHWVAERLIQELEKNERHAENMRSKYTDSDSRFASSVYGGMTGGIIAGLCIYPIDEPVVLLVVCSVVGFIYVWNDRSKKINKYKYWAHQAEQARNELASTREELDTHN